MGGEWLGQLRMEMVARLVARHLVKRKLDYIHSNGLDTEYTESV